MVKSELRGPAIRISVAAAPEAFGTAAVLCGTGEACLPKPGITNVPAFGAIVSTDRGPVGWAKAAMANFGCGATFAFGAHGGIPLLPVFGCGGGSLLAGGGLPSDFAVGRRWAAGSPGGAALPWLADGDGYGALLEPPPGSM